MNPTPITVFDPPMCCSTGVCGPEVDPRLARFSADLDWLAKQGITVRRFNLAQEPGAFTEDTDATGALEAGESALPLIKAGGDVVSSGAYPSREELAQWAGLTRTASLYTDAVAELVAIGAAVASNCESCFKLHFDKARKLGVSREDMQRAVDTAQAVRDTRASAMLDLAERYLEVEGDQADAQKSSSESGCCGSSGKAPASPEKESSCC